VIVAVDGPAAAGKGTVARAVARHLGFHFLDTGSLYRMVGLAGCARGGGDPTTAPPPSPRTIAAARDHRDEDLRRGRRQCGVDRRGHRRVRAALLDFQRQFAARPPGAVLDGRDIGTVVCPDAEAKLYITASPEVRARRRMKELAERGEAVPYETVLAEIRARDARDRTRATAPLVAAADATVIDTSDMGIEEAVAAAVATVMQRRHPSPAKG
jgi:cytidylate kinase